MMNYLICAHKTSLTTPLFIEVPVPSQKIEQSTLSLSMIFLLEFGPVLLIVCIAYMFVSLCYYVRRKTL